MRKHIVTCVKCGRQFDANEGGRYLTNSHRYVCRRCVSEQKKEQKAQYKERKADEREESTGMRQSFPAMIAKIAVGCLFLVGSLPLAAQGNMSAFAAGLGISAALIAWGLMPYLKSKR